MDAVERLEGHWLACMATAGGGGKVTRFKGATVIVNPRVDASFLNFILLRGASPDSVGRVLELGSVLLAEYRRPPVLFLSPLAGDMSQLGASLAALGWRMITRQAVLTCDLSQLQPAPSSEVLVREIGLERLNTWGSVLERAYEVAPAAGQAIRAGWTSLLCDPGEGGWARFYLAFRDRKPVGTGLLWGQGDIAGLYCGAVLPDWRRRGVERATLGRRLTDAKVNGAQLAVLQTEAGSPVEHLCLKRFGFRREYQREVWLPPTTPVCGQGVDNL